MILGEWVAFAVYRGELVQLNPVYDLGERVDA